VSDDLAFKVEAPEGNFDSADDAAPRRGEQDPKNVFTVQALADMLYKATRLSEAQSIYEDLLTERYGRPIQDLFTGSNEPTIRLAFGRKESGDDAGAETAILLVRQDHAARREAGLIDQHLHRTEAMMAAIEGNRGVVMTSIRRALDRGLNNPGFFDEPVFRELQNDTDFLALSAELDNRLAGEKQKVLQLICFENPVPDYWQPMPETCEGVARLP
jgi:hypothetical protein